MLSIIIVNWNTRDLLAQCLRSLASLAASEETLATRADLDGIPAEVLVVDNASRDGSAAIVRELFPWVQLIVNRVNVGFARANNQAIQQSHGRYVLLLNPDTEVRPNALHTLVRFMDEQPRAGAAGARLLNVDGSLQLSCRPAPTLAREFWRLFHLDAIWRRGSYRMAGWDVEAVREVEVVGGACVILHRQALDEVGCLDEDYFMYSEEEDVCHRLTRGGWRMYWEPRAAVVHYGGESTRQARAAMFQQLYRSKVLFFRKRHGSPASRVYKLILLAAALSRILAASSVAWLESAPRRRTHLAGARDYYRLIRALPRF